MVIEISIHFIDPLVFDFQFVYDGYFSRRSGINDFDAYTAERLCQVLERR